MAQNLEICSQLGFANKSPKRLADILIDEVEHFAVTKSRPGAFPDIDEMLHEYLYSPGAGERIWGRDAKAATRPPLEWPKHQYRIKELVRQMFSIVIQGQPGKKSVLSAGKASPVQARTPWASAWDITELGSGAENGWATQLMDDDHTDHSSKAEENEPLSDVPSEIFKDYLPTSGPLNPPMMASNFLTSGSSEQMPLITRSEAELVKALNLWIQDHEGRLPPGSIKGSILNVQDHIAKQLIFVGTSATVLIDRLLINKTTIGWVLRAADGSCMFTKHNSMGSNMQWRGYSAWLGDDLGFTDTIIASTDGIHHKPIRLNEKAIPGDLSKSNESTSLPGQPRKKIHNADTSGDFSVTPKTFHTHPSSSERADENVFVASLAEGPVAIKPEIEGHRYPTHKRRLASFANEFEAWELQGNRGEQTPPISSFNTVKRHHRPPQHPGTPSPTPQKESKRQEQARKLQEAACLKSNRRRSPSIELMSVHQASPYRRGRPRMLKFNGSYRVKQAGRPVSAPKLRLTFNTSSGTTSAETKPTPTPTASVSSATIAKPYQTNNIVFHFFLSSESFGAIPKIFAQCATPECFFKEAKAAYHALGKSTDKSRLLGVKVTIEGVTRPIVVLWKSKDGFERMVEAISNQRAGQAGNLNVEVRCIKLGQAM